MKEFPAGEIDLWLRGGGLVVTASDRAARAITGRYHRARMAEGLTAWAAPDVRDWKSFVRDKWQRLDPKEGRLLLNATQELALWAEIAGADRHIATMLEGPRRRIAKLAMEAHGLLFQYAPQYLKLNARSGWQQDAGAFSGWLADFDQACRVGSLISESRLGLELCAALEESETERPTLLLAGFDRFMPTQREILEAWGEWREVAAGTAAEQVSYFAAADAQTELAACALWCGARLKADPTARLLVVAQDANQRRGEIERAFLKHTGNAELFEFSVGVALSQVAVARAALLLLGWLTEPLTEAEVDWLIASRHTAADTRETAALEAAMRQLRRRNLERTQWTLRSFLAQRAIADLLPTAWAERMRLSQGLLEGAARRTQTALEWSELVPRLLEAAGWPGGLGLSSAEHQAVRRWRLALEEAGSLGFDGRRVRWGDFLAALRRTAAETLFAAESQDASIQIAGAAESAGLTADAVWFLGADEEGWPASGATHPLLPLEVQRAAGMPHATAGLDWELAEAITRRLLAATPEICWSYARQKKAAEARPSRLIVQIAGAAAELPQKLSATAGAAQTVIFEDTGRIPFAPGRVEGGSSVLTAQSQCPFKAFAQARLGARGWRQAEAGLSAAQRGQLLHAVLQAVWSEPPEGIRSLEGLLNLRDRKAFVAAHVERVLHEEIRAGVREQMPRRYLELEGERLTHLVSEWLEYEATRVEFVVTETEAKRAINLEGLALELRLDRVDRLKDGSMLVIDYKTGNVWPRAWDLPRPEDVQLPLYAGFGLEEELGGLVFAKVRAGEHEFAGRVGDAKATLIEKLSANSGLMRNPLTAEQLMDWRDCIEQLARDFLSGKAEVAPRDYPETCEYCGLEALCRVQENQGATQEHEEADDE